MQKPKKKPALTNYSLPTQRQKSKRRNAKCEHGDEHLVRVGKDKHIRCRLCNNEIQVRYRLRIREEFYEHYGRFCACCLSTENLEVDHVLPVKPGERRQTSEVIARAAKEGFPPTYQVLCKDCNNWKSNGPFCPCPEWDKEAPDWRERIHSG